MIDDPFLTHYLILWSADGDEVVYHYHTDKNKAYEHFKRWAKESDGDDESNAEVMMINMAASIQTSSMVRERHWSTGDDLPV